MGQQQHPPPLLHEGLQKVAVSAGARAGLRRHHQGAGALAGGQDPAPVQTLQFPGDHLGGEGLNRKAQTAQTPLPVPTRRVQEDQFPGQAPATEDLVDQATAQDGQQGHQRPQDTPEHGGQERPGGALPSRDSPRPVQHQREFRQPTARGVDHDGGRSGPKERPVVGLDLDLGPAGVIGPLPAVLGQEDRPRSLGYHLDPPGLEGLPIHPQAQAPPVLDGNPQAKADAVEQCLGSVDVGFVLGNILPQLGRPQEAQRVEGVQIRGILVEVGQAQVGIGRGLGRGWKGCRACSQADQGREAQARALADCRIDTSSCPRGAGAGRSHPGD